MVLRGLLLSRITLIRTFLHPRFCHSETSTMQNAYIRLSSGSEKFTLTFHYINENLNVDRKFNLNRHLSETVQNLLGRIQCNVEKIVNEKFAKRRKKAEKKGSSEGSSEFDSGPPPQVTVELLRRGNPVPSEEICKSLFESQDLLLLSLTGKKYHVILNPPWVDEIQLPKSILCNFPVYPSKFVGNNLDHLASTFVWYKRQENSADWHEISSGYMYTPTVEDMNCYLKITCVPKREMISGPSVEAVSKVTVEAGPGECPFELRHAFTKEKVTGDCFRVMTYNILAGLYSDTDVAKTELFAHCPPYALDIDYRKQLLMKEILGYNSDIICLQEVDERVFENDLQPILSMKGYNAVFHKKGNSVREGLACFVNSSRFRLVNTQLSVLSAELSERQCYQKLWEVIRSNQPLLDRLKEKPTSSQATILQSVDSPNKWLVIGNTHLYFHPDSDHIRLLQGGQTILFIEEVVQDLKEANPDADVSIIMCGDFNSTPECGVFQLMTTGSVPEDLDDWKSNPTEQITGLSLSQPFQFRSACGTPQYTNYTVGFAACLDYIFYQSNKMQVKEVIPLYSDEELQRYTALPNVVFPSDHVALISDIKWLE